MQSTCPDWIFNVVAATFSISKPVLEQRWMSEFSFSMSSMPIWTLWRISSPWHSPYFISVSEGGLSPCALVYCTSFLHVRVIWAPSLASSNSVGRSCQTAYVQRQGDFELLLMTLGHKYPRFFFPIPPLSTHSVPLCPLLSWRLGVMGFLQRKAVMISHKGTG